MTKSWRLPSLDYTSRDYQAIRNDAVERISAFIEEWTDHSPSDPGIVILQLFAGMHDVLHFYADRGVKENLITDVLGRRNMIALAALVGQRLLGKAPAVANMTFDIPAQPTDTSIPTGTLLTTQGVTPAVYFETRQDVTILAGDTRVEDVLAAAGRTFSGTIGTSNGQEWQSFLVADTDDVLDEGITVTVDGVPWTYIASLGLAEPNGTNWTYTRDERGRVYVCFGNGTADSGYGLIPDNLAVIEAAWRQGGGRFSSVPKNTIRTVVSTIMSGGIPISVSCTNPNPAEGGDEEEDIEVARRRIPRAFKANDRGVTAGDLEALAESIPGVVQSLALVTQPGHWTVYVAPHPTVGAGTLGGTDPFGYTVLATQELSQQALATVVTNALLGKKMGTDSVRAMLVRYMPVEIVTTLYLLPGARRDAVEGELATFLKSYFDVTTREIGLTGRVQGDANLSKWEDDVGDLEGVDYATTTRFQLRPMVETIQAVGTPVFSSIVTTEHTRHAYWEVLFTSPTVFVVYRQDIGGPRILQSDLGLVGKSYVSADGEVQFSITVPSGGTPPASGDRFRFRVSPQLDTVRILTGEMAVGGILSYTMEGGA
jgi:hypothetical protein